MPRYGVVLERVDRQILAVSRALEAAVRHFTDYHEMSVDPGAAVLQSRRHAHGFAHILSPHRRCQAILGIICPSDCVIGIRKAGDRDYGTEYLALHDFIRLPGAGHERRLEEKAPAR